MAKLYIEHKTAPMIRSAITGVILLLGVLLSGTIGYMIIEDYALIDALYMTVITIATVGFREVATLSDTGKLFTIFLILGSFGILGYVVTMVTRFVVDGVFTHFYKDNKVKKKISKLTNHVVICGFGRNGKQAAINLKDHGQEFMIIEKDPEVVSYLREHTDFLYIEGDSTQEDILELANIGSARSLIAALPVDADNLFVVLTAKQMSPELVIISRASDDNSDSKLKRAGANNVIMPDKIGGARMARLVVDPDVVEFIEYLVTDPGHSGVKVEEISCKNLAQRFANRSIRELDVANATGANIIGLKNSKNDYLVNPPADTMLSSDDQIFVLGTITEISALKKLISGGEENIS
ncbi:MAG: potassium channel protein [Bacteroidales bacterium]|nr:potassium channel protein [Bacteroidales bacterium]